MTGWVDGKVSADLPIFSGDLPSFLRFGRRLGSAHLVRSPQGQQQSFLSRLPLTSMSFPLTGGRSSTAPAVQAGSAGIHPRPARRTMPSCTVLAAAVPRPPMKTLGRVFIYPYAELMCYSAARRQFITYRKYMYSDVGVCVSFLQCAMRVLVKISLNTQVRKARRRRERVSADPRSLEVFGQQFLAHYHC